MTTAATVDRPTTAEPESRGRNRFTTKALTGIAKAIAAQSLGVDASSVSVSLGNAEGRLTLSIVSPIRTSPLGLSADSNHGSDGGSILDRVSLVRKTVRSRFTQLTGSQVAAVSVRVSRVITAEQERVT